MGNVFCQYLKSLPPPVFHLRVESGVVKDISGGATITNYGVLAKNDATEGVVMDVSGKYVNTNALSMYKKLWLSRNFSIFVRVKFNSFNIVSIIFASNDNSDGNAPGSLYQYNSGFIHFSSGASPSDAIVSQSRVTAGEWHDIILSCENGNCSMYINNVLQGVKPISATVRDWPLLVSAQSYNSGRAVNAERGVKGVIAYLKVYDRPIK